jgi:hypothetical protein
VPSRSEFALGSWISFLGFYLFTLSLSGHLGSYWMGHRLVILMYRKDMMMNSRFRDEKRLWASKIKISDIHLTYGSISVYLLHLTDAMSIYARVS